MQSVSRVMGLDFSNGRRMQQKMRHGRVLESHAEGKSRYRRRVGFLASFGVKSPLTPGSRWECRWGVNAKERTLARSVAPGSSDDIWG